MERYDKYEDWVEAVGENTPEIPKIITGEWLQEKLIDRKSYFRNWGFCFQDISECEFEENIDPRIVRKVCYSTRTKFSNKHPFLFNQNIFHTFDEVRKLHEQGIDGTGVNVAIIDFSFDVVPNELKESLYKYVKCYENAPVHFHGTTVSTYLCGKNLGVAPNAKLWFYGTRQKRENTSIDNLVALKDIYEQNKNGANIKIVNISASVLKEDNPKFEVIINKLLEQGCYVIDSTLFGKDFTCINQDPNNGELYYSDWQLLGGNINEIKSKIAVLTGGKAAPLVTTENDYIYYGQATYSWSIPILSGYFALALQINPDLTYDEFVALAHKLKKEENGIIICNITGIIEELKNTKKLK